MKVWKQPSAYSDKQQGNVLASSLIAEIADVPSLAALDAFEADWMAGRNRHYPGTWLCMVQEECADRRAELTAQAREAALDRQFQYAMDKDD